jgi:D-3-phosphoglycerate dehydrogenase
MTTGKNRKKVLIVGRMPQAGIDVLKKRDDVDYEILTDDSVGSLHPKLKDANAVTLGGTAFRQAELDAAPGMMVVARLGVGFDAVEIPARSR